MTTTITPTLTIQLDNKVLLVSEASEAVKNLVGHYDNWRQREMDATSELLMIKSAIRDLQTVLTGQITQDEQEKQNAEIEKEKASQPAKSPESTDSVE